MIVIEPVRDRYQVGQWDRVSATITSVKLLESRSPTDAVTSYECQASYRYVVKEKAYETSDVSIYHGSDNLSNFHQRILQELSNREKSGKPFQAYGQRGDYRRNAPLAAPRFCRSCPPREDRKRAFR